MRLTRAAAGLAATIAVALFGATAGAETAAPPSSAAPAAPSPAITWDRAANIREVAVRIGTIQRMRGAEAAIKHIDACYRTHGLASTYSSAFEGCIAQDYLESKLLTRIYSRLPPEQLARMGAPSADAIAQAMGRRLVAAFSQYKVSTADAEAFRTDVDRYGLPVFLKTVFPNAAPEIEGLTGKPDGNDKSKDKEKN